MSRRTCLLAGRQSPRIRHSKGPQSGAGRSVVSKWLMLALICFTQQHLFPVAQAFCPSVKCVCDDRLLSANCTNVPSISHIPVTLNPLLRRLTLRQLALVELSNSLAVYRQLEYLDLRSNHLRQVRYENFNFRSAPASVVLSMRSSLLGSSPSKQQGSLIEEAQHQELRDNNELLARHLKLSIDKSLSEDEIRFHLRELQLADNKIEQLGSGPSDVDEDEEDTNEQPTLATSDNPFESAEVHERTSSKRLRAGDLERMAPFLSLTKLEVLNLSSNRLRRLHQHVFLGLVHLKHLDLNRNLIAQVDKYAFVGLVELRELTMSHNHLIRLMSQLGLAFCNAPMNQLQWLEFSDSLEDAAQDAAAAGVSRLPNQMFICCPNLRSLQLNALQLRYIQVNAFDNLQRLESLSLAGNYLEQVPSSSLSYSNSNISRTLKHLDLSETLIEFVNAHSLESLQSLEHLSLNHMQRLVSFDLAALHLKLGSQQQLELHQVQTLHPARQQQQLSQQMQSRLSHLAAEHPEAPSDYSPTTPLSETNLGSIINHSAPTQPRMGPLINDQLVELHLRHNLRLQSVHSSLAATRGAGRRIRFTKLRELNLAESPEIRELPLSQMLALPTLGSPVDGASSPLASDDLHDNNLRIDLSSASSKLNCSSCQMAWLLDAGLRQLSGGRPIIGPQTAAFNPEPQPYLSIAQQRGATVGHLMQRPQQHFHNRSYKPANLAIVVSQLESLACQFPYPISLVQFLSLQQAAALEGGIVSHCPPEDEAHIEDVPSSLSNDLEVRWSHQEGSPAGGALSRPEVPWLSLTLSILAVVTVLLLALKVGTGLVKRARRRAGWQSAHTYQHGSDTGHFKWGPPVATSLMGCSPASSQQSSSAHMCNPGSGDYSRASILSSPAKVAKHCGLLDMHQVSGGAAGLLGKSYQPSWQVGKSLACTTADGRLIDFKGFREAERVASIVVAPPASRGPNLLSRLVARLAPGAAGWHLKFNRSSWTSQLAKPTLLPQPIGQLNQTCGTPAQDVGLFQHHANQRHLLLGQSAAKPVCLSSGACDRLNYGSGARQIEPAPEVPLGLVYSNLQQPPPESTSYLRHHLVQARGQNELQQHEEEKRLDMSASQQQQRHLLAAIGEPKHKLAADLNLGAPTTCSDKDYLEPINVIRSSSNNNNTTRAQVSHHSTASSVAAPGSSTNLLAARSGLAIPLTDANNHYKYLRERVCRQVEQATLSQQQQPSDALDYAAAGSRHQVERHIYVTLDRPIKQQNGPDEYSPLTVYEQPQASNGFQARLPLNSDSTPEDGKSFQWSKAGDKFGCSEEQHLAALGQQMTAPSQSSRLSFQAAMENTRQQLLGQSDDLESEAKFLRLAKRAPEKPVACTNVTGRSDCVAGLVVASQTGSEARSPLGKQQQQPFMGRNGSASSQQLKGTRTPPTGRSRRKKAASAAKLAADANGPSNRHQQASCANNHDDHVINGLAADSAAEPIPPPQDVARRANHWNQTMIGRRVPSSETARRRRLSANGLPTVSSSLSDEMSPGGAENDQSIGQPPDYLGANRQEMDCDSMSQRRQLPEPPPENSGQTQVISKLTSDTYTNQFYYCQPSNTNGFTTGGLKSGR